MSAASESLREAPRWLVVVLAVMLVGSMVALCLAPHHRPAPRARVEVTP